MTDKVDTSSVLDEAAIARELKGLIRKRNLHLCLECGKCSAVCPMLDFYGEYSYERSPRGVVEGILFDPAGFRQDALWYCLTCNECTALCPSGIDFRDFMMELRELLIRGGHTEHAVFCDICGAYIMPIREVEQLEKQGEAKGTGELLRVCDKCKKERHARLLRRVAHVPKGANRV